jgi:hypothetical protein
MTIYRRSRRFTRPSGYLWKVKSTGRGASWRYDNHAQFISLSEEGLGIPYNIALDLSCLLMHVAWDVTTTTLVFTDSACKKGWDQPVIIWINYSDSINNSDAIYWRTDHWKKFLTFFGQVSGTVRVKNDLQMWLSGVAYIAARGEVHYWRHAPRCLGALDRSTSNQYGLAPRSFIEHHKTQMIRLYGQVEKLNPQDTI